MHGKQTWNKGSAKDYNNRSMILKYWKFIVIIAIKGVYNM